MRRVAIIVGVGVISAGLFAATGVAQSNAAEQAIRAQIEKRDKGGSTTPLFTKDSVFWTGAYSKPQTQGGAANPAEFLEAPGRKNVVSKTQVERIVVAASGDLAYEYSTFTMTYDDDGGHHNRTGATLCVWQRVGGEWLTAAQFRRPYGGVTPDGQQR
jgi:ketosteroid isomerase-like protein